MFFCYWSQEGHIQHLKSPSAKTGRGVFLSKAEVTRHGAGPPAGLTAHLYSSAASRPGHMEYIFSGCLTINVFISA